MVRIHGITVEIGGDVGPLSKALESVNKTIKNTATQLKDVERLLKLDPSHTELLSQKQALLIRYWIGSKNCPSRREVSGMTVIRLT